MVLTFGFPHETWSRIVDVLAEVEEVERAVLFGSRALGSYSQTSDIDLALEGDRLNQTIVNKIAFALDDLMLPQQFDLVIKARIDNPDLIQHIEEFGQMIYPRENEAKSSIKERNWH